MKIVTNNPQFAYDFIHTNFDSSAWMTEDAKKWCNNARTWFKQFCAEIGATNLKFNIGHYYFYGFFEYKNQYWYFSSGDCRFKVVNSLLIRTAKNDKDFTGGRNQSVNYASKNFKYELTQIIEKTLFYILP